MKPPLSTLTDKELQSFAQLLRNGKNGLPDAAVNDLAVALGLPAVGTQTDFTAEELAEKIAAEASLYEFVRAAWPVVEPDVDFIDGVHVRAVCDHIEAVIWGEISNLLANIPPGCMKSLCACVFAPAWSWIHKPSLRWLFASYEQSLSTRDSMRCRQIIQSDWYRRRWGDRFDLVGDQNEKCLALGTRILTCDRGPVPIERLRTGDAIYSVNEATGRVVPDRVVNAWSNGIKPVRRIRLSDGTIVRATANHRFYNWDRWGYVSDLCVGDALAVVRNLPCGDGSLCEDDAFLLALWLAEGSKNESSFTVTTTDLAITERLRRIASDRGWTLRRSGDISHRLSCGRKQTGNTPQNFLKQHFGFENRRGARSRVSSQTTDGIGIPAAVFNATESTVREFVGTYIACDGHVACGKNHGVSVASASETLVRDFALLLKILGVKSRIYCRPSWQWRFGRRGKRGKDSWTLTVHNTEDLIALSRLNVYGKQRRYESLLGYAASRQHRRGAHLSTIPPQWCESLPGPKFNGHGGWTTRSVACEFALKHGHAKLYGKLSGELEWRQIVSIDDEIPSETWHLETQTTGAFIAEGIYSHNTRYDTDKRGWRIATSVGGRGTGEHPDIIVADDPHKVKEAESDTERTAAIRWWDGTISSRGKIRGVRRIVVMQRLHQGDLSGHILETDAGVDRWVHLCLPMRYEPDRMKETSLGWSDHRTEPGELLWPAAFPERIVAELEREMGSLRAAGQLQQRPVPLGGQLFHRDWFEIVPASPANARRVRYWDKAGCLIGSSVVAVVDADPALSIDASRSSKYIRDIVPGDMVLTRSGPRLVVSAGISGFVHSLTTVVFDDGRRLTGTPDHPVWSEGTNSWQPLERLVATFDGSKTGGTFASRAADISTAINGIPSASVTSIGRFIGTFGPRLTDRFPVAVISTTATEIGAIIDWRISNVCGLTNTARNTLIRCEARRLLRRFGLRLSLRQIDFGSWTGSASVAEEPTAPGRRRHAIALDAATHMSGFNRLRSNATNAGGRSKRQSVRNVDALRNVVTVGGCVCDVNDGNEIGWNATNAGGHSRRQTGPSGVVPPNVGNVGVPVYDVTVDGEHEFFANGILVHNTQGGGAYSAGVRMCLGSDGVFYVEDVRRAQLSPARRNALIRQTAETDADQYDNTVEIWVEQEPGSGGKESGIISVKQLRGFPVYLDRVTGDKVSRAIPMAAQAEAGNVKLVRGPWNVAYLDELESFPNGTYKDQVDGSSGAFNKLAATRSSVLDDDELLASGDPAERAEESRRFTSAEIEELPAFLRELITETRAGRAERDE